MKNEMAGAGRKYGVMLATWVAFGWTRLAFPANTVLLGGAVTSAHAASGGVGGDVLPPFSLKIAQAIGVPSADVKANNITADGKIAVRSETLHPLRLKPAEILSTLPVAADMTAGSAGVSPLPQEANPWLLQLKLAEVMDPLPRHAASGSAVPVSQADHSPLRLRLAQEIGSLPAAPATVVAPARTQVIPDKTVVVSAPAEDKPISRLQFAPVQYGIGGDVSYNLQKQTVGSVESTSQFLSANVRALANSFIWQPWFAQVKGGLGLGFTQSSVADGNSSGNTVTGDAAFSLLPSSRFPFEAHLSRSNSSQSVDLGTGSSSQTTSFGMSQRYRPRSGGADYMVGYDHDLWQGSSQSDMKQDRIKGSTSQQFLHQSLSVNGDATRTARDNNSDSTLTKILTANHNFRPNPVFSVETLGNLMQTSYNIAGSGTTSTYKQLNSSAFWRPAEKPYTANASLRVYELGTESSLNSAATSTTRTVNANVGGTYQPSAHVQLNGNGNVNVTESSGGTQTVSTSENLGASYMPDSITLGKYTYNRSISSGFTNSSDDTGSRQHMTLSPAHGLTRNMGLGSGRLTMSMQQGATAEMDSQTPSKMNMSHNGSLGWNLSQGRRNTTLRLSASDARTVVGEAYFSQMANMQATLDETFSRYASWNGNLTIQTVRQGAGTTSTTTNTTASADLSYRHQRAFNIPRLRFTSDLRVSGDAYIPVMATPDQQDTISWDNRLDYSIGLTQLRLSGRLSKANKQTQSLYLFSLTRQF